MSRMLSKFFKMKKNVLLLFIALIAFSVFTGCDKDEDLVGNFTVIVKLNGAPIAGAEVALSENVDDYDAEIYLKGPVTTGTDGTASFGELKAGTYYLGAAYTDGTNLWYDEYELTMDTDDFEVTLNLTSKK